jgi:drug/metabolite transporter, DME family
MPTSVSSARWSVLIAALLFGTGGAAIKGTTLAPIQVAGFRSAVAVVALVLFMPSARRGFGRDLLPAALAYAVTLVTFVSATKLTTSGAAIFLQSTAPLWVVVLSPALLGERFDRRDAPYLVAAALALALVFLGSQDAATTAPQPQLGNAIALVSGLSFALILITFRRLARTDPTHDRSIAAAVLGNALACVACLPFALPVAEVATEDVIAILYLGAVQVGLSYVFLGRGLRLLPAFQASLLLLLEPVVNPVLTWLVHGEQPSVLAALGGATLIGVLIAHSRKTRSPLS